MRNDLQRTLLTNPDSLCITLTAIITSFDQIFTTSTQLQPFDGLLLFSHC